MKSFKKLALLAGVASSVLLYSGTATAQETTSSLRGKVVSTSGAPMSGVTVVITHIPTGTTSTITTNSSGVYSARGLKVGGPYRVRLSDGSEYTAQTVEDLFLTLGTSSTVNLTAQAAGSIEEIVVTASQISSMIKTGASSLYGSDDLASMPSIGRDIKSTIRQDPAIWVDPTNSNALGIAGTNNRTNSFTVDGIRQNDDFGLNGNGYPTQRSPVSIDAIAQVAVQTAPFDVTYGRFQGGNINVVTKSGTNEFHGSAFYEYSDAGLVGSKSGTDEINVGEFKEKTYGFTFGGPIVQDKLFFFASYEKFDSTRPFEFGPEGSGASNEITGVTQADIDRVIEISNSVYGFDPLSFGGVDLDESDEKILVKMDWNITDNHRMTATYQRTDGNIINPQNTFDSFFGGGAGLLSTWYDKNDKLTTYSGQLFSDWSDNFSTEVKIGWKEVVTGQNPLGGTEFGLFDIDTPGGGSIFIGPDFFRHGNALSNDAFSLKIKADYVVGDHLITFGYERDTLDVFNLFVPGSRGDYTFDSIDDFEAQTPSSVYYSNAVTNNVNDGAARFKTTDNVVYIQDRFTPTDNLTVFAGVRLEWFQNDSSPLANANFLARNGFSNTGNLDGKSLILPRFGFNYVFDDRTVVRGGFGLFGGGSPNVWVSNSYSNNGVNIDSVFLPDPGIVDGFNVPQAAQDALTEGDGNVNAISPDANLPSIWKANIAVDYEFDLGSLGDGWDVTAEAIFARTKDQFIWTEARRSVVGTAPDGRPIYDVPGGYDLILDSTDLGKSDTYTINVSKQWVTDVGIFNARVGWAHIDAEDVNPGQSSTATSNFGKVSVTDRNNPTLAISDHEISNRYT
ncbi:MAG: TonB-dependent receptor, partial [Sphingomonadales bacterium]|nr:TonB-dependent receptor [Sphingomonadales bacterium]